MALQDLQTAPNRTGRGSSVSSWYWLEMALKNISVQISMGTAADIENDGFLARLARLLWVEFRVLNLVE